MTHPTLGAVTDSHVHLLPGRLGEKVRAFFSVVEDALVYDIDHDAVLGALAAEGVDEVWHLPYAHKAGVAQGLNEASQRTAATAPGPVRVVGGATVHPDDDDPEGIVRRAVDELALRVLKLHCSVGSFPADDPRLDPVWQAATELSLPVVVHAGHAVNGETDARELEPIARVATRHPGATIVIAHCGHPAVHAALDLVEAHAGVHADLTPVITSAPVLPLERLDAVAHKLLFGTDAPNTGVPAGVHLEAVASLPLPAEQLSAIVGGTARRLVAAVRG